VVRGYQSRRWDLCPASELCHCAAGFGKLSDVGDFFYHHHAVGSLVHLHLACCTPNLKVVEYLGVSEESDRLWYTEFPEPKDGQWSPYPDRPGLGLELNPESVRKYAV